MIIKKNQQKIRQAVPTQEQVAEEEVNEIVTEENNDNEDEIMTLFDLDNIDFSQRSENRRGSRRRGFRRIEDRNLVSRAKEEADEIRKNAYNEGYKTGIEQAENDINKLQEEIKKYMNA